MKQWPTMTRRRLPDLGLEPLPARSLILSALLGTHPPRLPARAIVALGSLFGMAEGTIRTALSRMVAAGEIGAVGGRYELGHRLLQRQAHQDVALHAPVEPWAGSWWLAIVDAPRRSLAERRAFRGVMVEHRMGELRPDTWLRPANIPGPEPTDGVFVVRGSIEDRSPIELAHQLWDLEAISGTAGRLIALCEKACEWLEPGDAEVLADTFLVSVATVRFLRTEPQLPLAIVGSGWPPDELRSIYERLQRDHLNLMRSFLAHAARAADLDAESDLTPPR
jgi:phenylacetic acid degradation operon negative regulatory protein